MIERAFLKGLISLKLFNIDSLDFLPRFVMVGKTWPYRYVTELKR